MLNYIIWDANPVIIDSFVTVRWYGLMFAIGFWIGFNIVAKMFKHEGAPEKWMGILLIWVGMGLLFAASVENTGHMGRRTRKPRRCYRHYYSSNTVFNFYDQTQSAVDIRPSRSCNSSGRRAHTLRQSDELRNLRT